MFLKTNGAFLRKQEMRKGMRNQQYGYLCFLGEIARKLQNGQLHQGDMLPSDAVLAKELSFSKKEVRKMMQSLNMMGILVSSKEEGNYLTGDFSESLRESLHIMFLLKQISPFDVCQMRRAMELTAYPMAFARREQLDLDTLKNLLDQIQCGNLLESIQADEKSHMWLIAASGNCLMEYVMHVIWSICSTQVNLVLSGGLEELRQKQADIHEKMYKGFMLGDLEMGLQAIHAHYDVIEQALVDLGNSRVC